MPRTHPRPIHRFAPLLAALALGGAAGCSTGDDADEGAPDAAVSAPDAAFDSSAAPDLQCDVPLAALCATAGNCPTYDELIHPSAALCTRTSRISASVPPCGGFVSITVGGTDSGGIYVFADDPAHALVEVLSYARGSYSCSGGPAQPFDPFDTKCVAVFADDDSPGCECPPASPSAPSSVLLGVPRSPAPVCDDAQIEAFLSCIPRPLADGGAACARFSAQGTAADQACAACLGPGTDGSGALRTLHAFPALDPNVAGCIAFETHDVGATGCAESYAVAVGCGQSACKLQCLSTPPASLDSCVERARALPACAWADPAGCLATDAGPTAVAKTCGVGASSADQFRAVARRFCGAQPDGGQPDAGPSDASPSDASPSDAGAD